MNKINLATKIVGGIAAGMVLYDAHKVGVESSCEHVKEASANRLSDVYIRSRRMEDRSMVTSKLKDKYFRDNADWNFPDKINAVTGYLSGAFLQMASDVIPTALATGALLSKKFGKYCALGLGIYGIKYLICDVIDAGR